MKIEQQQARKLARIGELVERMKVSKLATIDEDGVLRAVPYKLWNSTCRADCGFLFPRVSQK